MSAANQQNKKEKKRLSKTESVSSETHERRRLAQLLHDGPCQTLFAANLRSQVLFQNLNSGKEAVVEAKKLITVIGEAIREMQEIVRQFRH